MPLPLPFDQKHADVSRPSLDKVRELLGASNRDGLAFVADIPILTQGNSEEWAYVVRDADANRYLLMQHRCQWYVADQQELRDLTRLYATASQVAVRALIELTEGRQQDEAKARQEVAKSLNLSLGPEDFEANPALANAVNTLIDAAQKESGKKDGKA